MGTAWHVSGELGLQFARRTEDVSGCAEVNAVRAVLQDRHACGHHVVEETGELRVEFLGTARHQEMDVPALRYRRAVGRLGGQVVAFVHGDPVVEVRQHPRGTQPRDAGPDDDSVLPFPPH